MKRITIPELSHIVDELRLLKNKKLENIYQSNDELRMIIEDKELFFSPSTLHLTKTAGKREISPFALILRKYLRNKLIKSVTYRNLTTELLINSNRIILELFPKFNCILCDNSYKIIMPMKFYREIRPEEKYIFPDGPDFKNKERFRKFLSKKYPAAVLIRDYFGKYVKIPKEIKEKAGKELKNFEKDKILKDIRLLLSRKKNPQVVYKNKKIIDVLPFDTTVYKTMRKKYFDNFNEALDFFFRKMKKR